MNNIYKGLGLIGIAIVIVGGISYYNNNVEVASAETTQVLFQIKGTAEKGILIRDALASRYHYQEQVTDENGELIDNPETKTVFAKRKIREYIKNEVIAYRIDQFNLNRQTALDNAKAEVEGISVE